MDHTKISTIVQELRIHDSEDTTSLKNELERLLLEDPLNVNYPSIRINRGIATQFQLGRGTMG